MFNLNSSSKTSGTASAIPRLGTVLRFLPDAAGDGIRQLEAGGFHIARSSDFKSASSVPSDFGGADVQYFERFGIAVVRREPERLNSILPRAMEQKIINSARTERRYRTLGFKSTSAANESGSNLPLLNGKQQYLFGYRDAVNHLVEQLLDPAASADAKSLRSFEETSLTWGLDITQAQSSGLTGAGIKVAILDTGFDDQHPDFIGRNITKKLFASNSSDTDIDGHGTHCVGTACGPVHPVKGPRYGIAAEAEIYAGKVIGDDGYGTDRSIIAGMDWALNEGCAVISMSLGSEVSIGSQPSYDYEQIGQSCLDAGTLVIAAAGNGSRRPHRISPVESPADASTIMAVGAIDRYLQIAGFSCGGLNPGQDVDVVAPGVQVLSSWLNGSHERFNGTSQATPHVAGIAALIAQSDPKYRGWALWARLMQLTKRLDLPARDVGRGLIQAPGN